MNSFFSIIVAVAFYGLLNTPATAQSSTTVGAFVQQGLNDLAGPKAQGIGGGIGFTKAHFDVQSSFQKNESKIWTSTLELGARTYLIRPIYVGARGGAVVYHDGNTEESTTRWRPMAAISLGATGIFTGERSAADLQADLSFLPARKEGANPGLTFWVRIAYRFVVGD